MTRAHSIERNRLPALFQMVGYAEGLSFLLLLFIAMPLKYIWDSPEWVRVVGTFHGVLFLLYVVIATVFALKLKWKLRTLIFVYIASVLPFGPFVLDKYISRNSKLGQF